MNLYITCVEKEGPFLKVWGQTQENNSIYVDVEQSLLKASFQFDVGVGKISINNLQVGTLVCTKYKDNNKYYRAMITNTSFLAEGFVEVIFLDCGNKDIVPCGNIRNLQNFSPSLIFLPPLATEFILAEAHCPGGGEWMDSVLEDILKEIKYRKVQCTSVIQINQKFFVKLLVGGRDLCSLLINRGLMQPISFQVQQAVLWSMSMQRFHLLLSQFPSSVAMVINTYKTCTLQPGCQYLVYVSNVNDGPCNFSVQLKQTEEMLAMLKNDLKMITLRLLDDFPIPGTICLARHEDSNICRAVVINEVDNQFKVFCVDFGNYEVVPLDALYQIPFKYVTPKAMAIRFSLAGVDESTVTLEMQWAFRQFVDYRLLYMKVLPERTRMAIPKCEVWDLERKTSALDVVNRVAQNAYPEPVSFKRGFSQLVKVSYVYSCNRFYVQLVSKENELLKLMLDLQASCQTNEHVDLSSIKMGLPCCVLFESDQQWYRSQVVEVLGDSVKVRYIDYGNEEVVPCSHLKIINREQLTVLRPQAIECCLNGYQNMEEDLQRDVFFVELIIERQFTMKVVQMTNKKAVVELFFDSNYNITSLLLDKLAFAKSQVSPLPVQADNQIKCRKLFSSPNGSKGQHIWQDHKPGRTYVDLYYGNDDIKQLLIQDALAVLTQKIIPDIDIPLLLRQQFRAILKSVNNLSDIIIVLECGVALSCKMHNLEKAVTRDENNLKRFLEHTVIVCADNVIDDKLEITLYNTEGTKIEVVSPDEGAYDTVELPCPILILQSSVTGYVSHVDDQSIFIQPTEYTESVAYLLDQMYESYENLKHDGTIIPEVEYLYAAKSQDGNWYRARVTNISDTQASVYYIDYGNEEDVVFDALRQLSDRFLEICTLCVQVFVCVATDTLLNEDVVGYIYFGGIEWEGTVEVRACSDKISHEERIVSGVLSRPQSPILSDDVNDQEAQNEK